MNNVQFTYDTSEFERQNRWFSSRDWTNIQKRTLRKAANDLKKKTKSKFKSLLPMASVKNPKYNDKLLDAVRISKIKETGLAELSIKLHVMGTKKKGSGTFRSRFFEKGTKEREISPYVDKLGRHYNKTWKTGRIKPLYFFRDSVSNLSPTSSYINTILEQEINKINQKKF